MFGGGGKIFQLNFKLRQHRVKKIIRAERFLIRNGSDTFDSLCRPANFRYGNSAIQRHHWRIIEFHELIVER